MSDDLGKWLMEHEDNILHDIAQLVNMDSPTGDKAAVDRLGQSLSGMMASAGAAGEVESFPQTEKGDHLLARWSFGSGSGVVFDQDRRPALILCHSDTVFDLGEAARRPFRRGGNRAYGPGVLDMKAGIVIGLWALRALAAAGGGPKRDAWFLVTSDEEVGSPSSRNLIEELARQCAYVLVLEPGVAPDGKLKTWRKGVGMFHLTCHGRAAHAGVDPERGISAIEEMARQIQRLHDLTDFGRDLTVNVGVVRGGSRSNVVAERAEADIDVRVMTAEDGREIAALISNLGPILPGARVEVSGGMNRPPMERSDAMGRMFSHVQNLGQEWGLEVEETGTGGGSDGNFTAGAGVPTLDGLGAVGDGAHTADEFIIVDSLWRRAALIARVLETL
ncbi:MAG: M20 family metallopeptidase [Thermaerobacterales bacterium]